MKRNCSEYYKLVAELENLLSSLTRHHNNKGEAFICYDPIREFTTKKLRTLSGWLDDDEKVFGTYEIYQCKAKEEINE